MPAGSLLKISVPYRRRPVLKQPSLVFKIRRLDGIDAPSRANGQSYRNTRPKPGFHCLQLISIAAELADQIAVRPNVALVVRVTTLTRVHRYMNFAVGITA